MPIDGAYIYKLEIFNIKFNMLNLNIYYKTIIINKI